MLKRFFLDIVEHLFLSYFSHILIDPSRMSPSLFITFPAMIFIDCIPLLFDNSYLSSYERPLWFEQNPKPDRNALFRGQDALVGRPIWFDRYVQPFFLAISQLNGDDNYSVAAEYEACRERVGLIDMSSFTKFDIVGPDVVRFLQYLCSANIDRPIGTTVYTGMQHERGGYVTDCTLSRLSETRSVLLRIPRNFILYLSCEELVLATSWLLQQYSKSAA